MGGIAEEGTFAAWLMPTTETTLRVLKQYLESYRHYVAKNPVWVSEVESALYWVSYLLSTTRFHNSRIVSELLYSCSSLLTLFNDTLLRKSYSINQNNVPSAYVAHLQTILSFIEYTQVFLELTALQIYGRYGKWIIISIVEIVKALIRLILLLYFRQGLVRRQYLLPLNRVREFELFKMRSARKEEEERQQEVEEFNENVEVLPNADEVPEIGDEELSDENPNTVPKEVAEVEKNAFKLPSSGRLIRNIDSAPEKAKRLWITPHQTVRLQRLLQKHNRTSPSITTLNRRRIIGELLHIFRPIAHLATGAVAGGVDKWSPYAVSFGLDLLSLRLLQGSNFALGQKNSVLNLITRHSTAAGSGAADDPSDPVDDVWNWSEQAEIQRRYMSLFMYLLRSPFYDQYTKERLLRLLSVFANNIPIFGRLLRPFVAYLPEWQRVYFYVWNQ